MAEVLEDIESAWADKLDVRRCLSGNFVKVGADGVGHSFKGGCKWIAHARERYSEETRDMTSAYAEGE